MSNWNDRNVWVYRARKAVEEFAALDIVLPDNVLGAIAVMDRVAAAKPDKPTPTAIREALVAGAAQDEIDRLLLVDATYTRLASEHAQGHTNSAGSVLAEIRESVDVLMPALQKQANAHIAKLQAITDIGAVKLEHLVRAGRTADAKLLADNDVIAASLSNLYEIRDSFLTRGGGVALTVNGVNCSRWTDPDAAAAHARGKTPAEQYVAGLAAGCTLYYPSPAEAIANATTIADRRAAEAQRKREREHGTGSLVFMSP